MLDELGGSGVGGDDDYDDDEVEWLFQIAIEKIITLDLHTDCRIDCDLNFNLFGYKWE